MTGWRPATARADANHRTVAQVLRSRLVRAAPGSLRGSGSSAPGRHQPDPAGGRLHGRRVPSLRTAAARSVPRLGHLHSVRPRAGHHHPRAAGRIETRMGRRPCAPRCSTLRSGSRMTLGLIFHRRRVTRYTLRRCSPPLSQCDTGAPGRPPAQQALWAPRLPVGTAGHRCRRLPCPPGVLRRREDRRRCRIPPLCGVPTRAVPTVGRAVGDHQPV